MYDGQAQLDYLSEGKALHSLIGFEATVPVVPRGISHSNTPLRNSQRSTLPHAR